MIAIASVDQASDKSFDYIVIGGGTAGLALACRLTEDASKTVLVLEAGDTHFGDPITEMLAGFGKAFGNPKYDWAFNTAPQEHADGTVFTWNRGKGLGGSSFMNFYIWTMPSKEELDAWEALGNPGWNWDNIARYSNKAEVFVPPSDESEKTEELTYDLKYHGTDGPIATGFYTTRSGFDITLRDALATFGLEHNTEPVSGDHLGTNFVLASIDPRIQKRSDSRAYLKLAASRPNLTVLPNAPATQILSSSSSSSEFVASGVKFLFDGVEHSASAAKEVILSAGAIKSPQLLELSGIGNASALTKLGIETKVDLPAVGENVQEHIFAGMSWEFKEPGKYNTFDTLADPQVLTSELEKLKNGGDGLLTMGVSSLHFAPLKLVASAAADKVQGVRAAPGSRPGLAEQFTTQVKLAEKGVPDVELLTFPGFLSSPNRPEEGKKYFSLSPALNRMFSRGSVHAGSKDALSNPIVDPRYLEEEVDLEALLGFVKWTRELVHSETLKPHFGKEINPGPDVQTDEELKAWIKKNLASTFHGAGSCAMMPRDKGGVVDSSLKVYGTRNLRVVDMSIIPLHVNCHTQALVYGIAERAADIIKGVV